MIAYLLYNNNTTGDCMTKQDLEFLCFAAGANNLQKLLKTFTENNRDYASANNYRQIHYANKVCVFRCDAALVDIVKKDLKKLTGYKAHYSYEIEKTSVDYDNDMERHVWYCTALKDVDATHCMITITRKRTADTKQELQTKYEAKAKAYSEYVRLRDEYEMFLSKH